MGTTILRKGATTTAFVDTRRPSVSSPLDTSLSILFLATNSSPSTTINLLNQAEEELVKAQSSAAPQDALDVLRAEIAAGTETQARLTLDRDRLEEVVMSASSRISALEAEVFFCFRCRNSNI